MVREPGTPVSAVAPLRLSEPKESECISNAPRREILMRIVLIRLA
jgi:hypothetical protein